MRLRVLGPRLAWLVDLALALSFVFFAVQELGSSTGLETGHTDHLRHSSESWLFLHHGLDVYRKPINSFAADPSLRFPHLSWPDLPTTYPPGAMVLFLPFGILENGTSWGRLSEDTVHRLSIVLLLFIGHLAVKMSIAALAFAERRMILLPAFVIYLFAVRWSLAGQYDLAYFAAAAAGCVALARAKLAWAVFWLSLAWFVHYRALVFAPVGIVAAVKVARSWSALSRSSRFLLFLSAVMIAVSLYTLALCAWSFDYRYIMNSAFSEQPNHWLFMGFGLLAVAAVAFFGGWLEAAMIAASLLLAATDKLSAEWRLLYFLAPFLVTRSLFSRQVALAWALVATPLVWQTEFVGNPLWLVPAIEAATH